MSSINNPCARQIMFAGEIRLFNLNDPAVLATMAKDISALRNMALLTKFMGKPPLAGQYGDTPAACLKRFIQNEYSVADIENVIVLGLIGGGMDSGDAFDLVAEHVTGQPLGANALVASEVITALFVGAEVAA